MKNFIKVNFISSVYGLSLFIAIELIINVYRISRVTGWSLDVVMVVIPVIILIGVAFSTLLMIRMIRKWMIGRKTVYWSVLIWCPYFLFFYYLFTFFFPLNSGETWFPLFNILIYGLIVLYPIYLFIMNRYATSVVMTAESSAGN